MCCTLMYLILLYGFNQDAFALFTFFINVNQNPNLYHVINNVMFSNVCVFNQFKFSIRSAVKVTTFSMSSVFI